MTKLAPARRAALAVLSDTRRRDGRIRDIIRTHPAFSQLSAADSALATRLAVGATAARDLLDELLLARVRKPSSLEPRVLDALRISAFELLYLETPSEVAVSQGVELVRSASPRAAGMANAVLRKVAEIEVDDGDLRMVSGLPAWLIGRIAEDDGPDAADRLARCNLEPAPVYVFSEHADGLAPLSPTATDLDRVYELRKPAGFFSSGLVQSGTVVVSDLAAQHVCAAVAELTGADLLEIGQGSGTKTLIIAQRCDARIAAVDVLPSKVASAQARISRAGLGSRVRSFAFDGTELGGSELTTHFRPGVRYGNGLECWTDSSDVLVENCRFSNTFDVAITMQGNNVTRGWVNMTFRGNVIWNCQQGFEIWSNGELENTGFQNCVFENNVCIDTGYSWGYDVRGNKHCSAHLLIYQTECPLCDVTVRNNTFYNVKVAPIFKAGGLQAMPKDYKIINNLFMIAPKQDIILRHKNTDEEYQAFYEKLAKDNVIIESEFYMPMETNE
jgi:16S rRNA (cytosine967-C5)-methyltransferase